MAECLVSRRANKSSQAVPAVTEGVMGYLPSLREMGPKGEQLTGKLKLVVKEFLQGV